MFFKKIPALCLALLFFFPFASNGFPFAEFTCVRDMKAYLPLMKTGRLEWERQKRFFRCVHDSLEFFFKLPIGHDPSRDHFTKQDIFNLFHILLEVPEPESWHLTHGLFSIKKALIGGSSEELKDSELQTFFRMVYDFREGYYYLHEVIPIFKKAFQPGGGRITSEEMRVALQQVERSFNALEPAYEREKVTYRLDDLGEYGTYIQALFKGGEMVEDSWSGFAFLEDLLMGILHPQKEIRPGQWSVAFKALHKSIHLFLYYKTHFGESTSEPILSYRKMEMADLLFSSLQLSSLAGRSGFNIDNLDRMLKTVMEFFAEQEKGGSSRGDTVPSFIQQVASKEALSLFTRTVDCFALKGIRSDNCLTDRGDNVYSEDENSIRIAFKDMRFEISENSIKSERLSGGQSVAILSTAKILVLREWLDRFKESFLHIYQGDVRYVADNRGFSHWLRTFFGWEPVQKRLTFASFRSSENPEKALMILNCQAFLELLFSLNTPAGFLPSKESGSIDKAQFMKMMKRIIPSLFALGGEQGMSVDSLNRSLNALFFIGDSFTHSSNKDNRLNGREFLDTAIYLVEALRSARFVYGKISAQYSQGSRVCKSPACMVKEIFKNPSRDPSRNPEGVLAVYPRLAGNAFLSSDYTEKYKRQIERILTKLSSEEGQIVKISDLTEMFLLLQLIEVNLDRINRDSHFNLSSEELLPFVERFFLPIAEGLIDEQLKRSGIAMINPLGQEGTLAWLMYSFKIGQLKIPLFPVEVEGIENMDSIENLQYIKELLRPSSFDISPNDFRFFIFDVYQFYSSLSQTR